MFYGLGSDGTVGAKSRVADVTFAGADLDKKMLQQSLVGGISPELGANTPELVVYDQQVHDVPF